jgi:hypothetical protein
VTPSPSTNTPWADEIHGNLAFGRIILAEPLDRGL